HGAAPRADIAVPTAAALRHAGVGCAPPHPAAPAVPGRGRAHPPPPGRRDLLDADHPVALPRVLRGCAPPPPAAHRAAPGVHRHRGAHVVAGAVTRPRAAARELPHAAPLSLPARPAMSLVGALITLSEEVLYPFYTRAPRVWELTPLADQQLGGLLMWVVGTLVLWAAATVVWFRWAAREESGDVERAVPLEAYGNAEGRTRNAE